MNIHACPGTPLARPELRIFMEELLSHTSEIGITTAPENTPVFAAYPASGFATLRLRF